ncbi:hypothetical protein QJS66_12795 [Kocuria rhizophila]|nr:hypothetical protein QJS66_12795 [Kocuria rhizophila]
MSDVVPGEEQNDDHQHSHHHPGPAARGNATLVASEFAVVSARRDQLEPPPPPSSGSAKYALKGIRRVHVPGRHAAGHHGVLAADRCREPAIAHLIEVPMRWLGVPSAAAPGWRSPC